MRKFLALLLTVLMLLASCGPAIGSDTTVSGDITDDPTVTDPTVTNPNETEPTETEPPVKVDRFDYTIDANEDTYVVNKDSNGDQSNNSSFSTDVELNLKTNGNSNTRYTYLKFDISSLVGDNDFTCIDLDLMQVNRENDAGDPEKGVVDVFACDPNINVNELTFSKQPDDMAYVTTNAEIDIKKVTRSFPITDYVRFALQNGQTEIVLCLKEATPISPLRIRFASIESGANAPKLSVYYGTKVDDQKFIEGGLFAEPEVSENGLDAILGQKKATVLQIKVLEDSYTEAGASADKNFGTNATLAVKGSYEKADAYYRAVLVKFNVEEIPSVVTEDITLCLYVNGREGSTPIPFHVYACDPYEWDERTVTYNTIPQKEELVASLEVNSDGWVSIDITDYVKKCRANGEKLISFILEGENDGRRQIKFTSKDSKVNIGYINYSGSSENLYFTTYINYKTENPWEVAMKNVTEWLVRWEEIKSKGDYDTVKIQKDPEEYSLSVDVATAANTNGYKTKYTAYPTRTIDTLKGYKASTAEVAKYDQYGGLMDESMKQEATGFFYVKKIGDRWWNIDPLGYPMFRVSMVSVALGSSPLQEERLLAKYGSKDKWAQATTDRLRELGFNSYGAWCTISMFIDNNKPLNQTQNLAIAANYATKIDTNISDSGSTKIVGNVVPAFDPDFATYAESRIATNVQKYKDSPYIYGWMSDNELPQNVNALDNALGFDTTDMRFIYSYATAWTFMYLKTGKADVSLADVTDELRQEFHAMMYDKYFSVVAPLIKKYDPNHMYIGLRFHGNGVKCEYLWRVAGYWCDVITYNYYSAWDADFELVANQVKWAGKPFVVTEWYAKGMDVWEKDNRMTNASGAGWTVRNQEARGQFYQNFALSLLECKGCVGFDWFKYIDNDPDEVGAKYEENSNKGIVDNYGEEYTVLTDYMKELNDQKYNLIKFFDER